ncbi:Ubiquitin-like-specific protease ESD4 [Hypsizygus marmoreus]|uniref:Ubiquitin-like-specific protease ESD4 n=1 Tax=Hypsizygus marmoreus TaxID=39966 RepID=A0A369J326_HYPMA|nr:Ubiquitin-like-specific protease ESD4 [Hypsizygus marmoreus]
MEDVWITPVTGDIPRWLEDVDVREGIRAVQKLDRCQEEQRRLGMEADNLCRWFGRELQAMEVALANPCNVSIATLLQQRKVHLLHLKPRWTNPLASLARFDSHVRNATHLATTIHSGAPRVTPTSQHATPPIATTITHAPNPPVEPDNVPLSDELEAADLLDEDHMQPRSCLSSDEVVFADLLLGPEEADETIFEQPILASNIELCMTVPDFVTYDSMLTSALSFQYMGEVSTSHASRALHLGKHVITFDARELGIFREPTARLNDVCINGVAAYLRAKFAHPTNEASRSAERCAIFSTHDLRMVHYNASDEEIWRRTSATMYWLHDVWILPIHRRSPSEHWVLCVIYPEQRRLLLFDSLAQSRPWRHEVKEIMQFITRLVLAANRNFKHLPIIVEEGWTAQPVTVQPCQTNGYDCGLWVLATIAAVLRGYHATGCSEAQMESLRQLIYQHIIGLPLYR